MEVTLQGFFFFHVSVTPWGQKQQITAQLAGVYL